MQGKRYNVEYLKQVGPYFDNDFDLEGSKFFAEKFFCDVEKVFKT